MGVVWVQELLAVSISFSTCERSSVLYPTEPSTLSCRAHWTRLPTLQCKKLHLRTLCHRWHYLSCKRNELTAWLHRFQKARMHMNHMNASPSSPETQISSRSKSPQFDTSLWHSIPEAQGGGAMWCCRDNSKKSDAVHTLHGLPSRHSCWILQTAWHRKSPNQPSLPGACWRSKGEFSHNLGWQRPTQSRCRCISSLRRVPFDFYKYVLEREGQSKVAIAAKGRALIGKGNLESFWVVWSPAVEKFPAISAYVLLSSPRLHENMHSFLLRLTHHTMQCFKQLWSGLISTWKAESKQSKTVLLNKTHGWHPAWKVLTQ